MKVTESVTIKWNTNLGRDPFCRVLMQLVWSPSRVQWCCHGCGKAPASPACHYHTSLSTTTAHTQTECQTNPTLRSILIKKQSMFMSVPVTRGQASTQQGTGCDCSLCEILGARHCSNDCGWICTCRRPEVGRSVRSVSECLSSHKTYCIHPTLQPPS